MLKFAPKELTSDKEFMGKALKEDWRAMELWSGEHSVRVVRCVVALLLSGSAPEGVPNLT